MKGVAGGDILEVRATDPGAVADFKSFCETTGDELVEWREDAGVFLFRIRKAGYSRSAPNARVFCRRGDYMLGAALRLARATTTPRPHSSHNTPPPFTHPPRHAHHPH